MPVRLDWFLTMCHSHTYTRIRIHTYKYTSIPLRLVWFLTIYLGRTYTYFKEHTETIRDRVVDMERETHRKKEREI